MRVCGRAGPDHRRVLRRAGRRAPRGGTATARPHAGARASQTHSSRPEPAAPAPGFVVLHRRCTATSPASPSSPGWVRRRSKRYEWIWHALVGSFVRSPAPRVAAWVPWRWAFRCGLPARAWAGPAQRDVPATVATLHAALEMVPPVVLAARVRAVLSVDETDALSACRCPVLCLEGARDRLVPSRCGDVIAAFAATPRHVTTPATRLVAFHPAGKTRGGLAGHRRISGGW